MKWGITIFRGLMRLFFGVILFVTLGQTQASAIWVIKEMSMMTPGGQCSIIGSWAPSTLTCTLEEDVTQTISIGSDGVTLDGAGYTVQGTTETGILISNRMGVTVRNVHVTGFVYGILIQLSSNNILYGNTLINNDHGVFIRDDSTNNEIYNNFFFYNTIQAEVDGGSGNIFNKDDLDPNDPNCDTIGGNYWSDWTGPDSDKNGFVDDPYHFTGGVDHLPMVSPNHPPVIDPVAPIVIQEYDFVEFILNVYDPDGDYYELSTEGLPEGAYFDTANGVFTWVPAYDQEGVFVVTFYATDNGLPCRTGQLDVIITVNDIPPTELNDEIIDTFTNDIDLPKEVDNSYLANLLKVNVFIENGMITPAINQLNAFINKVNGDIAAGILDPSEGQMLIGMASDIISKLSQ